ncbi:PucR family transcriptional regulator ligand-binding domain-containing protein [Pseudomonas sp. ZM23]|uniref:PucR family transcriptional regulator ligand-binding domain-containing protein n=1 Tax=Pseudomonas triclosanedens TaxID=2961893 RepID=A0ABY6ZSV4_9PSED|nr:PucR family transcriptional regulator ligand-binding domain-containing protein [Pseudomonas triclosanedens]MCP8466637.1 PucR family transcriptional regulator ligand-binding domain-containing protein [Pseudomonas triclosanedens]MCP8472008.1 PucR family transcriptional regulator ligand-binding domain-containing protein [Pseudomonas triclosanedens]MCP8474608.1 PucR family transcriptional regulator ligand-binding domain-containing protein [Pseudomonas triclosanedens]WAI48017.1 PucR family transc
MPLCIQDIIDSEPLRTRLLCGAEGTRRRLRWAHVCELSDPTEWLGEGDLLMTTGIGIPADPQAQRSYLERLARAKVAGLMIGENMQAPADLEALRDTAEQLGFAVLMTHYSVPFSAVTRSILDAGRQEEFERRTAISRIYESARMGLRGLGLADLVERLGRDVQARLFLFDPLSLEPWQAELQALPETWREVLLARRQELKGGSPAVLRCAGAQGEALVMALPSQVDCAILACGGELLDYGLLHHLVAVLGIELERLQVERERCLRLGSELLDDLLQQRLSERAAAERLAQLLGPAECAVLAVARADAAVPAEWQRRLRRQNVQFLVRNQGEELVMLLAERSSAPEVQAGLEGMLGVSAPLGHAGRMVEALREARLALAHACAARPLMDYAEARTEQPWLPGSLDEAVRVHRNVLGLLADYDQQQGAQLQRTLRVFLVHNRSWQKAAQELNVHKQTLVYRIRRIEEICGRSLDSTEDVAVLWIALRAAEIAGLRE